MSWFQLHTCCHPDGFGAGGLALKVAMSKCPTSIKYSRDPVEAFSWPDLLFFHESVPCHIQPRTVCLSGFINAESGTEGVR